MAKQDDPKFGGFKLSVWRAAYAEGDENERASILSRVEAMGIRAKAGVPLLVDGLSDKKAALRSKAAVALCNLKEHAKPATAALAVVLADKNSQVRGSAAYALRAIGPDAAEAVPALVKMLGDKDRHNRYTAASALTTIGAPPKALKPVAALFLDSRTDVEASWMATAVASFGAPAVPLLIKALKHQKAFVRHCAGFALSQIGPPAATAVPALVKALKDPSEIVQNLAGCALGNIHANPEVAIPALNEALTGENYELRRGAICSLGQFGPAAADAVPGLIAALESNFTWLAAESLGKIGPVAAAALPALRRVAGRKGSKDKQSREAALEAIRLIECEPLTPNESAKRDRFKPAEPGSRTFDFDLTREVVEELLTHGIADFAREHPDETVGVVGLIGWGFGCSATLCFGAGDEAPGEFGGLRQLKYAEFAEATFGFWPDLYEVGQDFSIKLPNGRTIHRSTDDDEPEGGNNAIDRPLFELLRDVLKKTPLKKLKLAKHCKVGVEMHDSALIEFWQAKR